MRQKSVVILHKFVDYIWVDCRYKVEFCPKSGVLANLSVDFLRQS